MSGQQQQYVKGECYLLVGAKKNWRQWEMQGFTVRKTKPDVGRDQIAMKISLRLPVALFEKPTLAATIDVDGEVPVLEIEPETIHTVQDLIRAQTGLDVELRVIEPED